MGVIEEQQEQIDELRSMILDLGLVMGYVFYNDKWITKKEEAIKRKEDEICFEKGMKSLAELFERSNK